MYIFDNVCVCVCVCVSSDSDSLTKFEVTKRVMIILTAAECKIFKEGKRILTEYPGGFKCQGDKFVCGAKLTVQSTFYIIYYIYIYI